jgi:hypothetical protein
MSASDYILKRKYEVMCNKFETKDANNQIIKTKINCIRCISSEDVFGNTYPITYFEIPLDTTKTSNAIIESSISTTPLIYSNAPLVSIKMYSKK